MQKGTMLHTQQQKITQHQAIQLLQIQSILFKSPEKTLFNATEQRIQIEVICSDLKEHQRRVENRKADILNHNQPTWSDVLNRDYEPWEVDLVIDTAKLSIEQAVGQII